MISLFLVIIIMDIDRIIIEGYLTKQSRYLKKNRK